MMTTFLASIHVTAPELRKDLSGLGSCALESRNFENCHSSFGLLQAGRRLRRQLIRPSSPWTPLKSALPKISHSLPINIPSGGLKGGESGYYKCSNLYVNVFCIPCVMSPITLVSTTIQLSLYLPTIKFQLTNHGHRPPRLCVLQWSFCGSSIRQLRRLP